MTFVLHDIRSAWNVGSAFRTADCLGANLILVGYTPRPTAVNQKLIHKTAIGAELTVIYQSFQNYFEVFEYFPVGYHVAAEISENSTSVFEFIDNVKSSLKIELHQNNSLNFKAGKKMKSNFDKEVGTNELSPTPLIDLENLYVWFGNEIHGVEPDVLRLCQKTLHLPMSGQKESLNVASSLAAMGYLLQYGLNTYN